MVMLFALSGASAPSPAAPYAHTCRKGLEGVNVGSREMFAAMNEAITTHRLHPLTDRVFPFDEVKAAYHYFTSTRGIGKVVIDFL